MATLKQNLDPLKFYAKNAYIRVILFRTLLLLITQLSIWYFKKNNKVEGKPDSVAGKDPSEDGERRSDLSPPAKIRRLN